jgi:uncharacterized coiled-coil DUF342 family protein
MAEHITLEKVDGKLDSLNSRIDGLVTLIKGNHEQTQQSIEELALSTAKGFDEVHQKFKNVDERFDGINANFDIINSNFNIVNSNIESLALSTASGFDEAQENRVNFKLEMRESFNEMNKRFDKLEFKAVDHTPRIVALEDKMNIVSTKLGLQS